MNKILTKTGISLIILVIIMSLGAYNVSQRDKNSGPFKSGKLIEKRELHTPPFQPQPYFLVLWEKHPTLTNTHEDVKVDANMYNHVPIGSTVSFPTDDIDYPFFQQVNTLYFPPYILLFIVLAKLYMEA